MRAFSVFGSLATVAVLSTAVSAFEPRLHKRLVGGQNIGSNVTYMAHIGVLPKPFNASNPDNQKGNGGGPDAQFICSGVIISPRFVVTAAHCFLDRTSNATSAGDPPMIPVERLFIGVGSVESAKSIPIGVKGVRITKEFSYTTLENDIGLVELATPLTFGSNPPISALKATTAPIIENQALTLLGWGKTSLTANTSNPILQGVNLVTGMTSDCKAASSIFDTQDGKLICTAPSVGKGPCAGDGGSPLVAKQDGQQVLVGLLGFAKNRNGTAPMDCASKDIFSFYAHVSQYADFIKRATNLTDDDFLLAPAPDSSKDKAPASTPNSASSIKTGTAFASVAVVAAAMAALF
ncbi:trypsin-like serine protease [Ramicandelaber brevisporus]|nr:trypsin-like serine protease [Ramicandelaber brevisporus]